MILVAITRMYLLQKQTVAMHEGMNEAMREGMTGWVNVFVHLCKIMFECN